MSQKSAFTPTKFPSTIKHFSKIISISVKSYPVTFTRWGHLFVPERGCKFRAPNPNFANKREDFACIVIGRKTKYPVADYIDLLEFWLKKGFSGESVNHFSTWYWQHREKSVCCDFLHYRRSLLPKKSVRLALNKTLALKSQQLFGWICFWSYLETTITSGTCIKGWTYFSSLLVTKNDEIRRTLIFNKQCFYICSTKR